MYGAVCPELLPAGLENQLRHYPAHYIRCCIERWYHKPHVHLSTHCVATGNVIIHHNLGEFGPDWNNSSPQNCIRPHITPQSTPRPGQVCLHLYLYNVLVSESHMGR